MGNSWGYAVGVRSCLKDESMWCYRGRGKRVAFIGAEQLVSGVLLFETVVVLQRGKIVCVCVVCVCVWTQYIQAVLSKKP